MISAYEIQIGDRVVGKEHPCYVIAEAGVNHNGDLNMAFELIDVAVAAGADAVKFQTFNPSSVFTKTASKAKYQKTGVDDQETAFEMLSRLALTYNDFRKLNDYAQEKGIVFFSKGHKEDIDFLVELGVPVLKIDSSQLIWYSYIEKMAQQNLPIILSTGTCTLGEVEKALDIILNTGNQDVIVLHCTTAYPTPPNQINLKAMATLEHAFGLPVGFSDHSEGIEIALAAVGLGAVMIEKHYTLDRNLPGPDHQASLEPKDLNALVAGIRKVETALGSFRKQPTPLEKENMKVVRRSMVAECDIRSGEIFDNANISFKRPAGGLGEEFYDVVLGRVAVHDIEEGQPITWRDVGGFGNG